MVKSNLIPTNLCAAAARDQRPAEAAAVESHGRRTRPANPPSREGICVKGIEPQQAGGEPLTDTRSCRPTLTFLPKLLSLACVRVRCDEALIPIACGARSPCSPPHSTPSMPMASGVRPWEWSSSRGSSAPGGLVHRRRGGAVCGQRHGAPGDEPGGSSRGSAGRRAGGGHPPGPRPGGAGRRRARRARCYRPAPATRGSAGPFARARPAGRGGPDSHRRRRGRPLPSPCQPRSHPGLLVAGQKGPSDGVTTGLHRGSLAKAGGRCSPWSRGAGHPGESGDKLIANRMKKHGWRWRSLRSRGAMPAIRDCRYSVTWLMMDYQ
jgi:hypothetical protein